MWSATRHQKILAILEQQKQLSTDGLAEEFNVSRETIRRDLVALEAHGHIERIHGGAVLAKSLNEEPFSQRINIHQKEKRAIAKMAAELIKPAQCIFVDAGTTTAVFAAELRKLPELMVITNSVEIATNLFAAKSKPTVMLLGGQMISDVPGTFGELTLSEIARFNVDFAFLAPVSINNSQGAAYFELHEAEIARAMCENAQKTVILADHSKLGETSRVKSCECADIDVLITGAAASAEQIAALQNTALKDIMLAK